jgi:hypothetical protein
MKRSRYFGSVDACLSCSRIQGRLLCNMVVALDITRSGGMLRTLEYVVAFVDPVMGAVFEYHER